jgi:hypothetical protein
MIAHRAGGGSLVGNADLTEGRLLDRQRAMASSIACSTRFFNTAFLLRLISCRANSPPWSEPVEAVAAVHLG